MINFVVGFTLLCLYSAIRKQPMSFKGLGSIILMSMLCYGLGYITIEYIPMLLGVNKC